MEVGIGEGGGETEVVKGGDVTMETTIVGDRLGLIVVDIRMAAQLLEGEPVDVQLPGLGITDNKEFLRLLRKIIDFIELVDTDIASQPLSIAHDLSGEIGTDSRHGLEGGGIGGVEGEMGAGRELLGRMGRMG